MLAFYQRLFVFLMEFLLTIITLATTRSIRAFPAGAENNNEANLSIRFSPEPIIIEVVIESLKKTFHFSRELNIHILSDDSSVLFSQQRNSTGRMWKNILNMKTINEKRLLRCVLLHKYKDVRATIMSYHIIALYT